MPTLMSNTMTPASRQKMVSERDPVVPIERLMILHAESLRDAALDRRAKRRSPPNRA